MELMPLSPLEQTRLRKIYLLRKKEFELETYVFDLAHSLAEEVAKVSLAFIEERAWRDQKAEWCISYPYAIIYVKPKKSSFLGCSYKINKKRVSREEVRIAIAVNALIDAEIRVK